MLLKNPFALLLLTSSVASATYNCPPVCRMYCEFGFVIDKNGCQTCQCKEEPSAASVCPQVRCSTQCPNGFQVDANGCQGCECVPTTITSLCGRGEAFDSVIQQCVAVSCDAPSACEDNETCTPADLQCVRAPCPQFQCEPSCPPVCAIFCEFGNVLDNNGCATCQCNPAPCVTGEEYDNLTGECVVVSCDSPKACGDEQACVPAEFMCIRAPCPQFQCDDPTPTCGPGEAYDNLTGECVIVGCESPDACESDETCVTANIQCIRAPCPNFQCQPACPKGEVHVYGRCRPMTCDSRLACSRNARCIPTKRSCYTRQLYCPQFRCRNWWNWW